ncbi:MAG TPA: hypothetical protein VKF40_23915 [Burkholderiales bacterium]|nr:hypothetical protein [Burkholderiales bacterium]
MIPAFEAALGNLRQSAKPILFATGLDEAPYAGAGTGFLVLFHGGVYLLTANHVVDRENLDDLVIFPTEKSSESIPFDARFSVLKPDPKQNDFGDLTIVRVALDKLDMAERSLMHAIRLDTMHDQWRTEPGEYQFACFGYPTEAREVDYGKYRILSTQHLLVGRLAPASSAQHCFEIDIDDFNNVSDLDGFSGSPVVAISRSEHRDASLCGMAIRGSKANGRLRFIDVAALLRALEQTLDA